MIKGTFIPTDLGEALAQSSGAGADKGRGTDNPSAVHRPSEHSAACCSEGSVTLLG